MLLAKAFTLVELLVVISIAAIVVSIVAPVSYRSYIKFKGYIEEKEIREKKKFCNYLSFLRDEECKLKSGKIVCGNKTIEIRM